MSQRPHQQHADKSKSVKRERKSSESSSRRSHSNRTSSSTSSSSSSSSSAQNKPVQQIKISKEQLAKIEPFQLQKRKSIFQCPHLKFQSATPPPKLDPKIINYPFDLKRFVPYRTTTLEQNYKHLLLTEPDLGIPIDLINPNTYQRPENAKLEPEDRLLAGLEPIKKEKEETSDMVSNVSWLRKAEYLGMGSAEPQRVFNTPKDKRTPTKSSNGALSRTPRKEPIDISPEAEVRHVEKLFKIASQLDVEMEQFQATKNAEVLKLLKHPTNPKAEPVEIVSLLPNEELWANSYVRVIFDADPIPKSKLLEEYPDYDRADPKEKRRIDLEVGQSLNADAIVQSSSTGSVDLNSHLVKYLLPKRRKLNNESTSSDQNVREYETVRDYILEMNKTDDQVSGIGEEYYFLSMHKDIKEARYNSLGRTKISMVKAKAKQTEDLDSTSKVGLRKVLVSNREFNEKELTQRQKRSRSLFEEE